MKKQLILLSDMEGASGIFEKNETAVAHGSPLWSSYGRDCLTSDICAVCEAANENGIEEILLYDGHFAGCPQFNVKLEKLPGNVRVFDLPDRCFYWRRIRGQAALDPFGVVTVGQHARFHTPNAYFPHTIQSPPIQKLTVNGLHIAEIGSGVLQFSGTRYLANIGCAASMQEARELAPSVVCIPVKDKAAGWEPSPAQTYPLIKEGVSKAIREWEKRDVIHLDGPYRFELELTEGYAFQEPSDFPWKGSFAPRLAAWEAPSVEIGLELFNEVRGCIQKKAVI